MNVFLSSPAEQCRGVECMSGVPSIERRTTRSGTASSTTGLVSSRNQFSSGYSLAMYVSLLGRKMQQR